MSPGVADRKPTIPDTARSRRGLEEAVSLRIPASVQIRCCQDDYWRLARSNPDTKLEWSARGELIVVPPEGNETSRRNTEIVFQLISWARRDGSGEAYVNSAMFRLPDGTVFIPDASWVLASRLESLDAEQRRKIPTIAPDFVIELLSPSQSIAELQEKMEVYARNGVRLGWLIDPESRTVTVYRPGQEPRTLANPERVSGEDVLPGFELETRPIFSG